MMAFSPCQYGYLHYHADVPQAVELLLESVRERRVTRQIAACERYIGHELGAGDRYLMLADLSRLRSSGRFSKAVSMSAAVVPAGNSVASSRKRISVVISRPHN